MNNLGQFPAVHVVRPDHADDVKWEDDDDSDVDGAVLVEVGVTEHKLEVDLIGRHHPTAAECCKVRAVTCRTLWCCLRSDLLYYLK